MVNVNAIANSTGKPDPRSESTSVQLRQAQAFSKLGLKFAEANDVHAVAHVLLDFCSQMWEIDCYLFTIKRSESNYDYQSILSVDIIDGKKVVTDLGVLTDYSPKSPELLMGKSLLINRDKNVTSSPYTVFGDKQRISASLLFAPILTKGQIAGVISVQSYTYGKFNENDRELLMKVADSVGPTILRCLAEQRIQEFLYLAERLNKVVDTNAMARVVATTAAKLLGWEFISVHIIDKAAQSLELVLALSRTNVDCRIYDTQKFTLEPVTGNLKELIKGTGVAIDHSENSAKTNSIGPFGNTLPLLASTLLLPVRSQSRLIGLLCIQNHKSNAYGKAELNIARGLADSCGSALERSWIEQNLMRSEASYRLLLENINDGIVISQNDHFVFFNPRFAAMLGYTDEELALKDYKDIYSEPGLEILRSRAVLRERGQFVPDRYETIFHKSDGGLLPVEANVRIIEDFHGKKATFAVIRDISERKAVEAKLHKSDEELRTLFNAMSDIILVIDENGRYLSHSSNQNQLLFTPWQNLADKTLHEVFPAEKADYFLKQVKEVLATGKRQMIEYDHSWPDLDPLWYNATITPLSEKTVLMVVRDITERRKAEEQLFRSNAYYRALLDGSEDYIFVLDKDLRFVHVNTSIQGRYGIKPEARVGRTLQEIYGSRPLPEFADKIKKVFKTGLPVTYDDDATVNGRLICTETVISPVFSRSGEVETIMGISRDVTERRKAETALKQSEQRYALAMLGANDGIWDWNLETDELYLSPRWWDILGEPRHLESGTPEVWLQRVRPSDLVSLKEKINDHISGHSPHLEDEHRIRSANGTYRWVLCRGICVRNEDGEAVRIAGSLSDITDRKQAEAKLHYGATHDALTGLPNRAYFLEFLEKAMARSRRLDPAVNHFAVLFLDLDRFKLINDSLGHLAGDDLIVTMARRLGNCVRPGDTVARMGGDEFTILLEGLNTQNDATRVAERVIREISSPVQVDGVSVQTTVSVGIAFDKREYHSQNDLLRDADTAMYRAKAAGRNRYQVFDQQMHAQAMEQLHWEADLRKAVARQEFEMHYQPVYKLSTQKLAGFEALIRWNHPVNGLTYPGNFIPLAEETGLIVPLGWWIIDNAARAAAQWNRDRAEDDLLTVSVNLSPRQLVQPGVVSRIQFLVANAGALPKHIIIEITENILMEDSQDVADTLQGLRQAGFLLDLDDFGTGYSSLSYLSKYPLDMLKIDRSFVAHLDTKAGNHQIVNAMLSLARGLHLRVTAEGVETRRQLDALIQLECDFAQGYYFGKAVPFDDVLKIIAERSTIPAESMT